MYRLSTALRLSFSRLILCDKPKDEAFKSTTRVMPITPAYTSPFLESDDYKFHLECLDAVREQQERDMIKSTEMERTRRAAKWVGLDMDSAKPKLKKAEAPAELKDEAK